VEGISSLEIFAQSPRDGADLVPYTLARLRKRVSFLEKKAKIIRKSDEKEIQGDLFLHNNLLLGEVCANSGTFVSWNLQLIVCHNIRN
jgi:hypothetical protein